MIGEIKRKSLLYRTEVEYGSWTINHVVGCMHGCKFPCYAFLMSKRFGRTESYEDWRKPKIVVNALELLEKEIPRYRSQIDFVHLSFMTDPFMYDSRTGNLIPEIEVLTLKIVERLNQAGIRVTILTKGFYPDEILDGRFLKDNEYGMTLVSLNDEFRQQFEPFSAPYEKRVNSLKRLHNSGLNTWVSIEPYPTPNLDKTAGSGIENLLDSIQFVDKIIFGRLNYNIKASKFPGNRDFYMRIVGRVVNFCEANGIKYHIKAGTPYTGENTENIFGKKTQKESIIQRAN